MSAKLQLDCEKSWLGCTRCGLAATRNRVVIGYGNTKAHLYFVGKAPSDIEDRRGEPFCDPAGELFNDFLNDIGLNRTEVFTNNIIGCRAFTEDGEGIRKDREPIKEEVTACIDRLYESIYKIDPILIVAMGNAALHALTGESTKITKARGGLYEARIPGEETDVIYPVLATFHPNYLRKNTKDKKKPGSIWYRMYEDLLEATRMCDIAKHKYYSTEIPSR